jgi:hypothetical protein
MLDNTVNLRPNSLTPAYPKYHKGDYFEEFFFKKFIEENESLTINGYKYLPIFWTNCYVNQVFYGERYDIQSYLNSLDPNGKYFMVSQHDDCCYERVPENTLMFSMGGNKVGDNIIPIPLICSPIEFEEKEKDILISFVGSNTHPIRDEIYRRYSKDSDFYFSVKNWSFDVEQNELDNFIDITSRSKFTLCPRGYGKSSFRLYEAIQMGSIPVYVTDYEWLPWRNEIDWNESIVSINTNQIGGLKDIILNTDYESKKENLKRIYKNYLTYDSVYYNIIKLLNNDNFSI